MVTPVITQQAYIDFSLKPSLMKVGYIILVLILSIFAMGFAQEESEGAVNRGLFTDHSLSQNTMLWGITTDESDTSWFTDGQNGAIGRVWPATGSISLYEIPGGGYPVDLQNDTTGRIWFTDAGQTGVGKLGRFDPSGETFKTHDIPGENTRPQRLAIDADGTLWFTAYGSGQIGKLVPITGAFTMIDLPSASAGPMGIDIDGGGFIWFTEYENNRIGRINPNKLDLAPEEFELPTANSGPWDIVVASDGRIWVTEHRAGKLAVFDPADETFEEFALPSLGKPFGLQINSQGKIWIADFANSSVLKFIPIESKFVEHTREGSSPIDVAVDDDDDVWVADMGKSRILRLT